MWRRCIPRIRRWCRFSARAGNCTRSARWASRKTKTSKLISDTVRYLKDHGKEVVYDAEHFFDGYQPMPRLRCERSKPRKTAGADVLVLCDTNGGTLTSRLAEIVADVRKRFDGVIGIHTHNDSEVAVANALAAIEQGCTHVQGCMNGYGERCGNANLCARSSPTSN